ncbi:MAG TPA: type II toxin-antitoxin system VapC family toxin [Thermoanaerobaculia bacterium]|nr:type II toxin-antitoxin system VapC family toxin [Thermoanaerobaculia bacterium]
MAALAAVLGRQPGPDVLDALASATVVLAPDLFASEVANGLWKYVAAGEISREDAADYLDAALDLIERFIPVTALAQEALLEASLHKHPVYDLCYAIAARREGCGVLTIDARLQRLLVKMKITTVMLQKPRS